MHQFGHETHLKTTLSEQAAEEIAIKALAYLSSQPEVMERFFALSGLDPQQLRHIVHEHAFLASLLDFMAQDDALLVSFASNDNLDPQSIMCAKRTLDPEITFDSP